ncbi:putative Rz1-like protein [Pseudomonas phage UNO-SLW4]|uniref:Putative Rz1-like protein n=4 Tax=Pifdecavirus UNOSLW1 TaxID=2733661 RepID=A0A1P8EDQ3_9CAUD|nr:Rz-like spanin [Pseudomonas phage UNO-SLW1]APV17353.1 putative Rz1-like protein [Pseudomonas phage UNO-SLW1]APV17354.1 putative Rz1-like protein [Pseudomonas phage UNO-SLW2]APV17355.1 putative Rz1-like protein [Pseudomonas phage UNO-SLW3]APV17356.1 putative Rz1-like protein [Pseudomonas phage UNO-SLW4]
MASTRNTRGSLSCTKPKPNALRRPVMKSNPNSMASPSATPKTHKGLKALLLGLWLSFVIAVSGCQSNLPTPSEKPSRHTIEASLMVEPNYTQRLLKLLSE